MSGTISTTIAHGTTLTSGSYENPITITGGIDASSGDGIFAMSNWSVDNFGTISAASGEGIFLKAGGVIDNSGAIDAEIQYGITSSVTSLSIQNSGYIRGGEGGVALNEGQISLDNLLGGTITGGSGALEGVKFSGNGPSGAVMINAGFISSGNTSAGGGIGLRLALSSATNQSTGIISGGSLGVYIGDYSQFTNSGIVSGQVGISVGSNANLVDIVDSGTIIGLGGNAISFAHSAPSTISDFLTLLPGAVLDGLANGDSVANVIFGGASAGTMATIGHELTLFPTISVETGAEWEFSGVSTLAGQALFDNNGTIREKIGDSLAINSTVAGTGTIDLSGGNVALGNVVAPGQMVDFLETKSVLSLTQNHSFSGTIVNFQQGDTIEISGFGVNEIVTAQQSGNLLSWGAGGMAASTITFSSDPGSIVMVPLGPVSSVTSAYEIIIPCFRAGTRILTPDGPRCVEHLLEGDLVITHNGEARPLIWVGQRWVDCDRHPNPEAVLPVVIEQGAFGPGVPSRDLYVSPDHAIYCGCVLIPAKYLINGISIRQVDMPEVTYHHIELEDHNVIWAETLPVETYLDCGNRYNFVCQDGPVALHANFAASHWDRDRAFADLVVDGAPLIKARQHLHDRLREQGIRLVSGCFDVFADGRLLQESASDSGQRVYRLPLGISRLTINSSSSRPADLDPGSLDCRRLGIAITDMIVDGKLIDESDPRFIFGFHAPEYRGRRWFRWTDGTAAFDATGARDVAFTVQAISPIWQVLPVWPQRPLSAARVLEWHSQ
jgi:hypothetical protein